MKINRIWLLSFAICVVTFVSAVSVSAQQPVVSSKPRVAVFGFLNLTDDPVFDIPAETVGKNLSFALKLLGLYDASEPESLARNYSDSTLSKWCFDNSTDMILYGTIKMLDDGSEEYRLCVFDSVKKMTIVRKTASGESVLDVFSVSDELVTNVLSDVTGRTLRFGTVAIVNSGIESEFSVSIDGILVTDSPKTIERIVCGPHNIRVFSGNDDRGSIVSEECITVGERETTLVKFSLSSGDVAPLTSTMNTPQSVDSKMIMVDGGRF